VLPDGRQVTFAYDSAGNLTAVTPPGKPAHTFVYAPADRLASYHPPTNGLSASATGYSYNTAGQVTAIHRPTEGATGDSIGFGYDLAGRPNSATFDPGTIGFTFNGVSGNLTSLSAPGGLGLAFTYDGALPTSVTWSGAVSGSTAVTYNSDFRVTGQTVNGSHAVGFGYDLDGLLTQAGALGLRRDAQNGRLDADSLVVGDSIQKSAYGYDSHGALGAMLSTRGADTLLASSYVRDSLSRITQLTERVNGTTQVVGFTYDSVGRLATVTRNSVVTASYVYDLNGNRASKTTSGGTVTATVDDQDRLVSYGGASYSYTNNGELSRKVVGTDTTHYTYDALGNLTQVLLPDGTAIGYLIDAQNRRIGTTVNDTLVTAWLYQGQLTPVAELDGQGNVVSRFVYATGVNVPDYLVRGDSTYRIVRDHLGSVRLVVNVASGTIAQRIVYDEFGIETENTNPGWQPFGYAGGLTDAETGLVRFGARDYDPVAGRWTAKDPIGFAGRATSLYEYAANDPANVLDPSGAIIVFAGDQARELEDALKRAMRILQAAAGNGDAAAEFTLNQLLMLCRNPNRTITITSGRTTTGSLGETDPYTGNNITIDVLETAKVPHLTYLPFVVVHELGHSWARAIVFPGVSTQVQAVDFENAVRRPIHWPTRDRVEDQYPDRRTNR
jgi:RHS repeat-associated protein